MHKRKAGGNTPPALLLYVLHFLHDLLQLVQLGLLIVHPDSAQGNIGGIENGVCRLGVNLTIQQHISHPITGPAHFSGSGHLHTLLYHGITTRHQR